MPATARLLIAPEAGATAERRGAEIAAANVHHQISNGQPAFTLQDEASADIEDENRRKVDNAIRSTK